MCPLADKLKYAGLLIYQNVSICWYLVLGCKVQWLEIDMTHKLAADYEIDCWVISSKNLVVFFDN